MELLSKLISDSGEVCTACSRAVIPHLHPYSRSLTNSFLTFNKCNPLSSCIVGIQPLASPGVGFGIPGHRWQMFELILPRLCLINRTCLISRHLPIYYILGFGVLLHGSTPGNGTHSPRPLFSRSLQVMCYEYVRPRRSMVHLLCYCEASKFKVQ